MYQKQPALLPQMGRRWLVRKFLTVILPCKITARGHLCRGRVSRPVKVLGEPLDRVPHGSTVHRTVEPPLLIFLCYRDFALCGVRPRALPSGHPRFFEKNRVKLFLFLPEESGILPIRRIYISRRKSSPSSGWCEAVRPRRINSGVTPPARIRRNRWCGGREGRPGCWKRR